MEKQIFPVIRDEDKQLPFYITSIGENRYEGHVIRQEGYPSYQWLHTARGKGKLIVNNQEYTITENMGFFLFPQIPHEYFPIEEPWETHWITFNGNAVENLLNIIGFKKSFTFSINNMTQIEKMIFKIYSTLNSGYISNIESSSLLYCFLVEAKKQLSFNENNNRLCKIHQLEPVVKYIEENFNSDISLTYISSIIGITPNHLCRIFKELYDITIMDYTIFLRIKKAKEYLAFSRDLAIKDIGHLVGYSDVSYFCALFKKHEGITPLKFRLLHKKY